MQCVSSGAGGVSIMPSAEQLLFFSLLVVQLLQVAISGESPSPALYCPYSKQWKPLSSSSSERIPPFPPSDSSYDSPLTEIYISLPNFMDGERCAKTLDSYISKAKYPKRLNFGIIEQIDTEVVPFREGCLAEYCRLKGIVPAHCHFENIKQVVVSQRMARGLSYARAMGDEDMMADEEFCMLSDTHTDLIPDWDMALMNMWAMIQNEYAIISTQPTAMSLLGKNVNDRWEVSHQCSFKWDEQNGLLRNSAEPASAIYLDKPLLSPTWTSKFSFSKCHALKKTPDDPAILRLDRDITDIAKFARLWTRGYDVYSPHRPIMSRDGTVRDGSDAWKSFGSKDAVIRKELEDSKVRVRTLLGMEGGFKDVNSLMALGRYGLGTKRTLSQLIEFMGVDFRRATIYDSRCLALSFVPFEFENNPHVESGDLWGLAPERLSRMSIPLVSKADPIIPVSKRPAQRIEMRDYGPESRLGSIFSWVDVAVESFIGDLMNEDFDENEAISILKIGLLVVPLVALLMTASLWALMSTGNDMRPAVKNEVKIV